MAASIEHYQLPLPAFPQAVRLLIVVSPYYRQIADGMIEGAQAVAKAAGATVDLVEVPGALEIPTAIGLAASREFLVVLAGGFELVLRLWVRPAIHLALRLLHGGVLLVFADGAHDERRGDDGKPDQQKQHRQHSKHARLCARTTLFCSGAASHWMDSSPLNKRHYPKS